MVRYFKLVCRHEDPEWYLKEFLSGRARFGWSGPSPLISPCLRMIRCFCAPVCFLLCRRAALWRQETREAVGVFRAAGEAKKWSRWTWG